MKKILMITYDFPPARTSGIYRPVKFVKHLRAQGWEPIVLTAKNPIVPAYDNSLLNDIPSGVRVVRTYTVDLFELTKKFHDLLYRRKPSAARVEEPPQNVCKTDDAAPAEPAKRGWLKRYFFSPLNVFVEHWVFIPDRMIAWFPFAFLAAIWIMITERPDVVFSTSCPQTAHVIGIFLKILFRKPWIVDLRDNWFVGNELIDRNSLRGKLDFWAFKKFLKHGDQVVTMCAGNGEDLIVTFNEQNPSKYQTITNGFDRDDFTNLRPRTRASNGKVAMLHMGTLYEKTPGQFFHALASLQEEDPRISEVIDVVFIGFVGNAYTQLIEQLNLRGMVRLLGFRPHPEAIQAMRDADVLLMFLGERRVTNQQFPGKFFEYMNAHNYVLALGMKGEIAAALEQSRCGQLVLCNDTEAIKNAIRNLIERKRAGQLTVTPNREFVDRYEYGNLTADLVKVLDKAQATMQ